MIAKRQTIAKRLVKLRKNRTQKEIADSVNISVSALAMYESGKRIPRDEVKAAIAEYYNVSIEALFFTP
jgi:transcriptional regulator with XRE-family HTH domain